MAQNEENGSGKVGDTTVIPVVEEQLKVGIREEVTGMVRVTMRTETVEEVVEQAVESIYAHVTRIPIDREIEKGAPVPAMRTEDGLTIIPVLEEFVVVEKRLRLVEEVHIKQQKTVEQTSTPVSLRRQRATVEHSSAADDDINRED